MTRDKRIQFLLHLLTGAVVILVSALADRILSQPRMWGANETLGTSIGLAIIVVGLVATPGSTFSRTSMNLSLTLLSVIIVVALGEGFFRLVGYDFRGEEQAWRKTPIYYRQPMTPTGDVYFRRAGPDQWTGQVRNTLAKQRGIHPNPYAAEPVVTASYDRKGFRNPDDLSDWSIAIAGDSHTELGYLTYDQLFTSILARKSNVSVLNLGTSHTGPLTQLSYLRDYGVAASTEHAMIVFYEGNDLENLASEFEALIRWRETGQREYREFTRQPSLLKAVLGLLRQARQQWTRRQRQDRAQDPVPPHKDGVTAYFRSSEQSIPVTLKFTPAGSAQLSDTTKRQLDYFFEQYANFGRERDVTLWLAYVPSKIRVLHGRVDFSASASARLTSWEPTDLPEFIGGLSEQHGINFIDLTPALTRETDRTNQLLYNSLLDSHLNSRGSMVVGQELARHFPRRNQ